MAFIGICPFYAIRNTFICIATIKVSYLSVINSSCNRGVDTTYKTIQATAHNNETVTIVATDVAGNEAEQLITVSVKETNLSTSYIGLSNLNGINRISGIIS
jgi:hypothetical protein